MVFLGGRVAEEIIYGRDTSKVSLKYLQDLPCSENPNHVNLLSVEFIDFLPL